MMNRRQVLRSLAAAALAAVAPIPAMGAAETGIIELPEHLRDFPIILDTYVPIPPIGPCCCDEPVNPYSLTISFSAPYRTYELPLLPDGSYGAVFEDVGEIRVTSIRDAFEKFKSRTDFEGAALDSGGFAGELIRTIRDQRMGICVGE